MATVQDCCHVISKYEGNFDFLKFELWTYKGDLREESYGNVLVSDIIHPRNLMWKTMIEISAATKHTFISQN